MLPVLVPEAALIALREGLEALLIVGVLLLLVTRLGHPEARRLVWLGFGAAVLTSLLAGWLVFRYLLEPFEEAGYGAWFEIAAALLAVLTLTYMAFWMWGHTNHVVAHAKEQVRVALKAGALATIVFIAYISVLREGLETVLFYAALSAQNDWNGILLSGAIGFLVSAVLVVLILTGARRIGLKPFMTVTGFFLLIVAAMLLTHIVTASIELGLIGPQRAIWDTSGIIPDDSALGRILHATLGYSATPTLLEALLYFGYLFTAGGLYLWRLGAFRRRTPAGSRTHTGRLAALAAVLLLVAVGVAGAAMNPTDVWVTGHGHDEDAHGHAASWNIPSDMKIGVLLRNHGEPIEYNATTYQSFADFMRHLLAMVGLEGLLLIDQGTVLLDAAHPFAAGPRADARLVDAWLKPYPLPAAYIGSPFPDIAAVPLLDGYYIGPAGPGLGEPDILELAGLSAYQSWLQMENRSPMHDDKLAILQRTGALIEQRSVGTITTATGYHIQPRVAPQESVEDAARALVAAGATHIVDAYTSTLHSDVMNGCMMQPHTTHALQEAGFRGTVLKARPSGLMPAYAPGIAEHIDHLLAAYPEEARIAVLLTHHGLDPASESPCNGGPDPYHEQAEKLFTATKNALRERVERDILILKVYGQGADGSAVVYSPAAALEKAKEWGATHVLDLPYELQGNGFDNLVKHRQSYGFTPDEAPYYGEGYETQLTRNGMQVRILSSAIAVEARAQAQEQAIEEALAAYLEGQENGSGGHGHGAAGADDRHCHGACASPPRGAERAARLPRLHR